MLPSSLLKTIGLFVLLTQAILASTTTAPTTRTPPPTTRTPPPTTRTPPPTIRTPPPTEESTSVPTTEASEAPSVETTEAPSVEATTSPSVATTLSPSMEYEYEGPQKQACSPNNEGNGFMCEGIELLEVDLGRQVNLTVLLNMNNSYDSEYQSFMSEAEAVAKLADEVSLLTVEFNSSVPNDTILASGIRRVGRLAVPSGVGTMPRIPMNHELTYTVTMVRDGTGCNDTTGGSGNETGSQCDEGTLVTTIGLFSTGGAVNPKNPRVFIRGRIEEPDLMVSQLPFKFEANQTTMCQTLDFESHYKANLTLNILICNMDAPAATRCTRRTNEFSLPAWNGPQTLVDNQCTELTSSGDNSTSRL